jgi:hypothetical protein
MTFHDHHAQGSPRIPKGGFGGPLSCKPGRFQPPVVTLSRHPAMAWDEKNRDDWAKRYLEPLAALADCRLQGAMGYRM